MGRPRKNEELGHYRRIWDTIPGSPRVNRLSKMAHLAWPHLFLVVDNWGRTMAIPRMLLGRLFSARDDFSERDVKQWLDEWEKVGLIVRYEVEGRLWLQILKWDRHQPDTVHNRRKCPELSPRPPAEFAPETSAVSPQFLPETSAVSPQFLPETSAVSPHESHHSSAINYPTEYRRQNTEDRGGKTPKTPPPPSDSPDDPVPSDPADRSVPVDPVIEAFQRRFGLRVRPEHWDELGARRSEIGDEACLEAIETAIRRASFSPGCALGEMRKMAEAKSIRPARREPISAAYRPL